MGQPGQTAVRFGQALVASARAYVNALNRLKSNKADVGAEYARAQV